MFVSYRVLWKRKAYMWNLASTMVGRVGDSIDAIGFSWMMYEITRSPAYTAVTFGINILPTILITPFAGAIIEQMSKKRIIVCCDIARAALTMIVFFMFLSDALPPSFLLLVTFLNNTLEAFRQPAATCFQADTLREEEYELGVSLNQSLSRACELIGTGIAGVILSVVGIQGTLFVDMCAFAVCALMVAHIHLQEQDVHAAIALKEQLRQTYRQLKEGLCYVRTRSIILFLCTVACILNMGLVPYNSFLAAYVNGELQAPAYVLSFMSMALSLGVGIGALLYPTLHKRIPNQRILFSLGIFIGLYYFALVGITYITVEWLMVGVLALSAFTFGITVGVGSAMTSSCFMKQVDREYLARASGINSAIVVAGMPFVSFAIAAISQYCGVLPIFFVTGIVTILLFSGMMCMKQVKDL